MKVKNIFLIGLAFVLVGCANVPNNVGFVDLSASGFKELIEDEKVFVLDVHIPEQEHIKGTDSLIPFDKIADNLDKLPKDKNTPIAIYCRSGSMSAKASQDLIDLGYTKVYNLLGGVKAWSAEGFEFEEK